MDDNEQGAVGMRITADALASALHFDDLGARIVGVSFDAETRVVEMRVEVPGAPSEAVGAIPNYAMAGHAPGHRWIWVASVTWLLADGSKVEQPVA